MSDRELYSVLWRDVLRQPTVAMPPSSSAAEHVPLVGLETEHDAQIYLRFYADEKERQNWLETFPGYEMPPMADPPYDRDSRLPQPHGPRDGQ